MMGGAIYEWCLNFSFFPLHASACMVCKAVLLFYGTMVCGLQMFFKFVWLELFFFFLGLIFQNPVYYSFVTAIFSFLFFISTCCSFMICLCQTSLSFFFIVLQMCFEAVRTNERDASITLRSIVKYFGLRDF